MIFADSIGTLKANLFGYVPMYRFYEMSPYHLQYNMFWVCIRPIALIEWRMIH